MTDPTTEPLDLRDTFQGLLIGGRWLLVAAESVVTLLLLLGERPAHPAIVVLLLLSLYNAISLVVVHRLPIRRVPVLGLLALDLFFVAAAAYYTGATNSPFLGQFYLIIFAAALCYRLVGAMAVGVASALITGLLAFQNPAGLWIDLRDLVPYFLIAGAFTGYLVEQLKSWFLRYQESLAQDRQRELQAEVARREMDLARSIQKAALPDIAPGVPGLETTARLQYAQEVGGDFYLFLSDEVRMGFVIGDVSGKGVPAALISTTIGHLLPWLRPLEDPHRALCSLNLDLAERLPLGAFVTLTLADVNAAAGRVRLWTAGHPPALLWCGREGRVVEGQVYNLALGLDPTWDGQPEEWPLEIGDVLLLYSDGLIEVRNSAGELFDVSRAARLLAENAQKSAEAIMEALVQAANDWGPLTDDLTVVICKRVAETPSGVQIAEWIEK